MKFLLHFLTFFSKDMFQYQHFVEKLNAFQMQMITTQDEFMSKKIIEYRCPKGHTNSLTSASFINKTSPSQLEKQSNICSECHVMQRDIDEIKIVLGNLNFEFLSFEREKNVKVVTYRCHCGNVSRTDWRNLKKKDRKSNCSKCQNNVHKINFEDIVVAFQEQGCQLVTKAEEYKNNKQKLDYICSCGHPSQIIFMDFKRGKRCMKCRYK
jgi:hypothetical protein